MPRRGFTLLEIVLAIGLSGAVIGLLTLAIDLYLVRVDASRTQVETAQLARTLLNQLAADIHAARYVGPASSGDSESGDTDSTAPVQGIYGFTTELRIDRSAGFQWERFARQAAIDQQDTQTDADPNPEDMPQTIRYVLGEGKEMLAAKLASQGVSAQAVGQGYAGLYREQTSTAAWIEENAGSDPATTGGDLANAGLFAPEVVDIAFAYFNGQELLTEWDSSLEESLPIAIEIRLTLLEEPFAQLVTNAPGIRDELRRSKENLVEYRRFVRLIGAEEPYEAEFPQPSGTQQSGNESPGNQSPGTQQGGQAE